LETSSTLDDVGGDAGADAGGGDDGVGCCASATPDAAMPRIATATSADRTMYIGADS
jgi:hypothetical protein